ncbi:uncharacterized protein LOC134844575 [Symsagittifera roscoffensis]|uniref:uncharacterized protein LOC134844575 n=1 Tax=Symsagittifera roscoffensis TaxID=84072 RepID=UPI00307B3BC4
MSLERALLHASSSSAFSGPKSMEGFEQLSIAFLTCLQYEMQYSINRLKAESLDDESCHASKNSLDVNITSSPLKFRTSKMAAIRGAREKYTKSFFGPQRSMDSQENLDSASLEIMTKNPIRTNEIIELSHLFLKTSLIHFKDAKDKLSAYDQHLFTETFEKVLSLMYQFLKLRKVEPFYETVAFGLIHILDSISDLDSDELINFSFKTLGKLLDSSAKDKFPQRKNPCLLLLNKMKTSKDPKLWKLGVMFLVDEVSKERLKMGGYSNSRPLPDTTYSAIVVILSKLLSYLDNDPQNNTAREVVLDLFFDSNNKNSESLLNWFFGNTVERCAKDKNNLDCVRSYFGIALSVMEMISQCTPEQTRRYLEKDTSISLDVGNSSSKPSNSSNMTTCWEIVETLLQLGRRVQDEKIGDVLQKQKNNKQHSRSGAKLLSLERRLPVVSDSMFGRRLFESDEYLLFKVKATRVMLNFIKHLIDATSHVSLKLDHLGVIVLESISQKFLQPWKFGSENPLIQDLIFPITQQDFGDLRVTGMQIFQKIWSLCVSETAIKCETPQTLPVRIMVPKQLSREEQDFNLVDFINFCCCDLVRLSVAMEPSITRPLCGVITEMIAEKPKLCEQHVISTLIQFDLHRNLTNLASRVKKNFYDRINSDGFGREKKQNVDEMKSRLKILLERQQLNIHSGDDMSPRSSFLATTLRLSFLIKFYSAEDQVQYRMFQDLYLRQMIKVLAESDVGSESDMNFYKAEIAQCYVKLAELSEKMNPNSGQDEGIEKLELLEQAAIHFHKSGRLVQAEKIFHEVEEAYRSKWMLKRLKAIRSSLDELYESVIDGDAENKSTPVASEWYYYVRLYGTLPSAVKDNAFIIRMPTSVEVSETAREISRIFPNIQRQNIGSDPESPNLSPDKKYFQISLTEMNSIDGAKESLMVRRSQLKHSRTNESIIYDAAKLSSSKFYSSLKTTGGNSDFDETTTSYGHVMASLSARSEASTFMVKWVQPHDNTLEQKIVKLILKVDPAFPYISPWNMVTSSEQKTESGLVLAMDFLADSIHSLKVGVEEVRKHRNIERHKGVFRSIICSPVQGGVQMYYAIADDDYVSKFDPKEVQKMRNMCSTLIDKLVDFMSAMKPHFVNDESIYNEYLFDAKCLFKHASLQFDEQKRELVYWLLCQKQTMRRLDLTQTDLPTFETKDAVKQRKLLRGLATYLEDLLIKGFENFDSLSKMCSGVKSSYNPMGCPSQTSDELLWDSIIVILSRFDTQTRQIGDITPFTAAFSDVYLKRLEFEHENTKQTILDNLNTIKTNLKLFE